MVRAIAGKSRRRPAQGWRLRGLYHVVRVSLIFYALASVFCAFLLQGCARPSHSDPLAARAAHIWTKPRVDLLVAESRERVLLARYAELQDDAPRAARYYHEAWCFDPSSAWLEHKRHTYQVQGLLDANVRCYATP